MRSKDKFKESSEIQSGKGEHEICHNPCDICGERGYLLNEELCPVCAGTGCRDKKYCVPAGGLSCEA